MRGKIEKWKIRIKKVEDDFLNEEDKKLSQEDLATKVAIEIVEKIHPVVAKEKLFLYEIKNMIENPVYFKKMYRIYLKKEDKNEI